MSGQTFGGIGMRDGQRHSWYVDEHGVRRWIDTDAPLDGEILKGNADLVPAEHAWMEARA